MISIIITSYKEPKTIGRAIESIARQKLPQNEILVTAPDEETLNEAKKLKRRYGNLKLIKDRGEGKPSALNLAVSKAKGDILILTDGDVYIEENSIPSLLSYFEDEKIGAVSGNPVSLNPKDKKYGFWSNVLTNVANEIRLESFKNNKRFFCSGYLFAIRKKLFPKIPENLLSEDGFISYKVYEAGFKIAYSEKSKVYVKYPDTFSDWIKQKKRSAGGYNQLKQSFNIDMRSFKFESVRAFKLLKYVSNLKEFLWLILLYFARVYLWLIIYKDINLKKKTQKEIWERVESTK
jgi:cellulose synthase/poly-beta-1,6-N-acetylglucosamine synthase-like glycosyltransferase